MSMDGSRGSDGSIGGSMVPGDAAETELDGGGLHLAYRGSGGDLFLVFIKNIFLTLVTLGIYMPWARTVRRRYLWRQVEIDGQRLEYTGTGRELFAGYLKVIGGYFVLGAIPAFVGMAAPRVAAVLKLAAGVLIALVIPFAIYWSRRYLLGRTRWRGIRFGLAGDAKDFARMVLKGALLTLLTLGLYAPVLNNRVYGFLMRNTRYGSAPFSYDGTDGEAFKIGIKGFFLSVLTLGIYVPWYLASLQRFRLAHTRFAGAVGSADLTGGLLFKVLLVSVLGNVLTLGLAFPWTTTYALRTLLSRLRFTGAIDFAHITQLAASGDAAGDLLAGALGVELGV
jgi:uncharacterized membrane protein YjgN (DUF898 family)